MQRLLMTLLFLCLVVACEKLPFQLFPEKYKQVEVAMDAVRSYQFDNETWKSLSLSPEVNFDTLYNMLKGQPAYDIAQIELLSADRAKLNFAGSNESRLFTYERQTDEFLFSLPGNIDEYLSFGIDEEKEQLYRPFIFYWTKKKPENIHFRESKIVYQLKRGPIEIFESHLIYSNFINDGDTIVVCSGGIIYRKIE